MGTFLEKAVEEPAEAFRVSNRAPRACVCVVWAAQFTALGSEQLRSCLVTSVLQTADPSHREFS